MNYAYIAKFARGMVLQFPKGLGQGIQHTDITIEAVDIPDRDSRWQRRRTHPSSAARAASGNAMSGEGEEGRGGGRGAGPRGCAAGRVLWRRSAFNWYSCILVSVEYFPTWLLNLVEIFN
jgi:hypothetical protein